MPRGDKVAYTDKQKRQAEHIEEGYEKRGVSEKEAELRAWATVNKESGGGKKRGSGRKGSKKREPAFSRRAVKQTIARLGQLDLVVNNAAYQEHQENLEDISEEQWDRTFKTNIYGYFFMVKAALPHLKKGSAIINTGSITGLEGSEHLLDYSATKGAIHAFTKLFISRQRLIRVM